MVQLINEPGKRMKDITQRFPENPLLLPKDLRPSAGGLQIISLLNPGVFRFEGRIWLLVRVAEGVAQKEGVLFFPAMTATGIPRSWRCR